MLRESGEVVVPAGNIDLMANWTIPADRQGVVVFVHGAGSSRFSPRNQEVAEVLQQASFATMLMDMLNAEEAEDRGKVFDIDLLTERTVAVVEWLAEQEATKDLPIGLFGASTGAAAALRAAARRPALIKAVVSRGGRPDLAWPDLPRVVVPTLLIVGERDLEVLQLNRSASRRLGGLHELQVVPHATHLFQEPGTLGQVAALAERWFNKYLPPAGAHPDGPAKTGRRGIPPRRRFADRTDAGERLAAELRQRDFTDPLILAIPRGGVVLGAIIADALHAELDVALARKLRMPGNPELAVGAVGENGDVYLNVMGGELATVMQPYLDEERARQMCDIAARRERFREGRLPAGVAGRSVIVTDDGIATGATMIAALRVLQGQQPREVIVGVPVASPDRLREVRKECDEVVCLIEAPDLHAVGQYYEDFTQVEDDEVIALLRKHAPAHSVP